LIGSHIADGLVAEGYQEIVVLDDSTEGRRQNLECVAASGKLTCVTGDIRNGVACPRGHGRLGFRAHVSLEEGLRQLVKWWRQARLVPAETASRF
jgi:nucleoside-diphosphate-sugar epimerase